MFHPFSQRGGLFSPYRQTRHSKRHRGVFRPPSALSERVDKVVEGFSKGREIHGPGVALGQEEWSPKVRLREGYGDENAAWGQNPETESKV